MTEQQQLAEIVRKMQAALAAIAVHPAGTDYIGDLRALGEHVEAIADEAHRLHPAVSA